MLSHILVHLLHFRWGSQSSLWENTRDSAENGLYVGLGPIWRGFWRFVYVPWIAAICYRKSDLAARIFTSTRFGLTDQNYRNAGGEFNRRYT